MILVTGCAGFVGSHLTERLLSEGSDVIGLDALTAYYDRRWKLRNLARSLEHPRFRFIETTVAEAPEDIIRDAKLIYHLAAQPGVRSGWGRDFETYVIHNVLTTQSLLERVRGSKNLARLVFASSSSVYGNSQVERVAEDHARNPHSPYALTKLAAENLCALYAEHHGVPVTILRLFTVCGPRQRPDMMLHRLIESALTGSAFLLYGDGGAHRDFTPVLDAVEGFVLGGAWRGEERVFNIAGGQSASVLESIALVEELTGMRIQVERRQEAMGDVRRTGADISKAKASLGYQPRWSLRDTVVAQIEFVRGQLAMGAVV